MTKIEPGSRLIADRYVLRSMIGRGGSGAVWSAEDLELSRRVAIKQIIVSEQRSTRSRARAMREARAVARLRSPGVVQVYDVYDDGAQIFLVMELIDAPSLSRLVRRSGALEPARAAVVGQAMLSVLATVHAAGIVHRDVKPSNVLVHGTDVHLTDFGIALFGDDPTLTAAGSVLGTPAYMAPEQARGERAGPAADMYGLGATLYYAVEGQAPFADVGSWKTTLAVRDSPHRPGERLGPLEPVVEALLHKDPDARPRVADIAAALDVIGSGTDLTPPPWPAIRDGDHRRARRADRADGEPRAGREGDRGPAAVAGRGPGAAGPDGAEPTGAPCDGGPGDGGPGDGGPGDTPWAPGPADAAWAPAPDDAVWAPGPDGASPRDDPPAPQHDGTARADRPHWRTIAVAAALVLALLTLLLVLFLAVRDGSEAPVVALGVLTTAGGLPWFGRR